MQGILGLVEGVPATHERVENTAVSIHITPKAVIAVVATQPHKPKRRRAVSSTARPEGRRVRRPAHDPGVCWAAASLTELLTIE